MILVGMHTMGENVHMGYDFHCFGTFCSYMFLNIFEKSLSLRLIPFFICLTMGLLLMKTQRVDPVQEIGQPYLGELR